MSKLTELSDKLFELRKEFKKDGEKAIKEAFKEFFAANPIADKIIWVQYTPYFNDGDACTFSMSDFEVKFKKGTVNGEEDDDEDDDDDDDYQYGDSYYGKKLTPEQTKAIKEIRKLFKECSPLEEIFESVFGDHVKIVATTKGFNVIEFNHD